MPTVRDAVSRVRSTHKLLSSDNLISDRAIEKELKSNAIILIRRETNLRRLWSTSTIFNEIPCLEMENVPLASCCDYEGDEMISRSRHKLPAISEGIYMYLIQWVRSVDKKRDIKESNFNRYANFLKMMPSSKEVFYIIDNRYIYVTQPGVKVISISAYFEDNIPKHLLYPDCPCDFKKPPYDECKNPLDLQFKCPGYLEKTAVDMTSTTLLQSYFRIEPDRTSDEKSDEKRLS